MALYHFNLSNIGKVGGLSAVAAAAYRSCSVLIQNQSDKETGIDFTITHDYARKKGLEFSKIFVPEGVDDWFSSREELWNKVEERESRVNARYARDIKLALQKEFTKEQNIELLSEFVNEAFVLEGIIADVNIHIDNEDNPHAHIMLTTREIERDENGRAVFGKKNRLLDKMSWLYYLRKRWADINNKYFKIHDIDRVITHESYTSRGFEYIKPTIHEGAARHAGNNLERVEINRKIVRENLEFIKENPYVVIKSLTKNKSTFSKIDIAKSLDNFINEIAFRDIEDKDIIDSIKVEVLSKFDELFNVIISSDELIKICDKDLEDRILYTTKEQLELEKTFLEELDYLNTSNTHNLNINQLITPPPKEQNIVGVLSSLFRKPNLKDKEKIQLSKEQEEAIIDIVNGRDISLLIGRPGTGKSTVMGKLVEEYKSKNYNVYGGAYSAIATLNLSEAANIRAYTLSKWQHDWDLRDSIIARGEEIRNTNELLPKLNSKDIFIIDEMSMVDLKTMDYFLRAVKEAGSKVIFVGDDNQFSSIALGGASDKLVERVKNVELNEIFRQKSKIDKEVTSKLASYKIDEAILLLRDEDRFVYGRNREDTHERIVNEYIGFITCSRLNDFDNLNNPSNLPNSNLNNDETVPSSISNKSTVILAYSNEEVKALNQQIRKRLIDLGILKTNHYESRGKEIYTEHGYKNIAIGERIVFTKNNRKLGLINGQIGIITKIKEGNVIDIEIVGSENNKANGSGKREITIDTNRYGYIDYGYALTAYKAQGKTYDNSLVLIDKNVGYESFNVMATRHRDDVRFYVEEELLKNIIDNKFNDERFRQEKDNNNLSQNNKEVALYELLVRRDYSAFAHDYMEFDNKNEVKMIRNYLNARDEAACIYRDIIEWQCQEEAKNNIVKISDHELWSEFKTFREERDNIAKEIIEGFKEYRKYLSNTNINYSTLLKHARLDKIKWEYNSIPKTVTSSGNILQEEQLGNNYTQVGKLQEELYDHFDKKICKKFIYKAAELLDTNYGIRDKLEHLQNDKETKENEIWRLNSRIKVKETYVKDFKHYLGQTFKDDPGNIIKRWEDHKNKLGTLKALEEIEKDPTKVCGKLVGVGIGKAIAINVKRDEALFNLNSLKAIINTYESMKSDAIESNNNLKQTEQELTILNQRIVNTKKNSLTAKQEVHLSEILKHEQNIEKWIKSKGANKHIESIKNIKAKAHDINHNNVNKHNTNLHNIKDNSSSNSLESIHNKLCDRIAEIAPPLLEKIIGKKVEFKHDVIKCGSLHLATDPKKRGLWHRFSTNEGGNLFDLIEKAYNLQDTKEAIDFAKELVGESNYNIDIKSNINHNSILDNKKLEKDIQQGDKENRDKEYEIVIPAPINAKKFDARKDLHFILRDKKHILEDVYEYRNINNELCGYVARIRDIEENTKQTLPIIYVKSNKHQTNQWRVKGFGDNRPLYNEHLLNKEVDKPILIVEGEKTVNVAQEKYPEFNVISWSGGANAYSKSNWEVLKNREIVIWPDNDQAGIKAAENIKEILMKVGIKSCNIVELDRLKLPEKCDLADDIPNNIDKYQITGLLFNAASNIENLNKNDVINRLTKESIEIRKANLISTLNSNSISNANEYIIEKEKTETLLLIEEKLIKDKFKTSYIIDSADLVLMAMDARDIYNKDYAINNDDIYKQTKQQKQDINQQLKANIVSKIELLSETLNVNSAVSHPQGFTKDTIDYIANASLAYTNEYISKHEALGKINNQIISQDENKTAHSTENMTNTSNINNIKNTQKVSGSNSNIVSINEHNVEIILAASCIMAKITIEQHAQGKDIYNPSVIKIMQNKFNIRMQQEIQSFESHQELQNQTYQQRSIQKDM